MTQHSVNVLLEDWTSEAFTRILDHFIPNRAETAEDFEFPQFSEEPEFLTTSSLEVVKRLEGRTGETYQLVWRNTSNASPGVIAAYFLEDGEVAISLAMVASSPEEALEQVVSQIECEYAFVSCITDPFATRADFVSMYENTLRLR
jgi:hypothetical protein